MPEQLRKQFCRNGDGSWTCTSHATIDCPSGRIQVTEGSRFYAGTRFMGFDLGRWLDEQLGTHAPTDARGDTFLSV